MDPEDFLEEPYNFGECWSIETTAPAYCNAWKNRSREIKVLIRKEGNYTHVHFPKALFSSREGINTSQCKVIVDLYYPLADKDSMFYISKCRSRTFVGTMQVYDHFAIKDKIVQADIDYDRNWGTLTFYPAINKIYESDQITLSKNVYDIGILDTTIIIVEESEDTVVSADEDDTMGERDPTISVFPSDINNEEYDKDGIPEGWIKETYNMRADNFGLDHSYNGKLYPIIHAKNKEGTKGILILPTIMGLIQRGLNNNTYNVFNVYVNTGFFARFPSGIIADDGEVTVYVPHQYHSSGHYQKTGAIIYWYDNKLHIAPKGACEYFFFLGSDLVKRREVGLSKPWKIEFDIPSSDQTYTNLRPNNSNVDISTFPEHWGTYTRTLPVRGHMHVWDDYVSGEAECVYNGSDWTATITIKNLLAPPKKTYSLYRDVLHINIEDFQDFYGGYLGTGKLSAIGKVKVCDPTTKEIVEEKALVYYYDGSLCVAPDGLHKYFFADNSNVTENIGLVEITIYTDILFEKIESYINLREAEIAA